MTERSRLSRQHQIAIAIKLDSAYAIELEPDRVGITVWCNHKVVFKLTTVAVIDQIDAGINLVIFDLAVISDIGPPLLRVIPKKVICFSRKLIKALRLYVVVRSHQFHAHDFAPFRKRVSIFTFVVWLLRVEDHDGFVCSEVQAVIGTAREKLHPRVSLTRVRFEV